MGNYVSGAWGVYEAWNTELLQECFGVHVAETPAYIDVDEPVLRRCAKQVGADEDKAEGTLVAAVRGTLRLDQGAVLASHNARYREWRTKLREAVANRTRGASVALPAPPFVALLGTSVLAAERMGTSNNLAANAYYPRLAELLQLDKKEAARLRGSFSDTEAYWRGLNEYLEAAEGRYGLPTAYALSFRYVGIPQSQALVRAADRAKLPDFFLQFGLSPGSELLASDLEPLLDAWITSNPSPVSANLQRLWRGGKARERISGVVAIELSFWDGSAREGSESITRSRGELQLTALMRQQFSSRSLDLSFAARLPRPIDVPTLTVRSAEGKPSIGVMPAAGSRLRPIPQSRLDAESLVGALLDLHDPSSDQAVGRRPRRVVPFRRDELLGVWVEADKVQLAESTLLLVKDEPQLVGQVLGVLGTYGAHGPVTGAPESGHDTTMAGVPNGWVVIPDVQVYRVPQDVKRVDLHVLVPIGTAQLILTDGLKMPGKIRKWSSLAPPEIRAAVSEADYMTISLTEIGEERTLLEEWTDSTAAMVVPLAEMALEDGDYEVVLSVNGEAVTQQTLRLRSGDTVDVVSWETCARLNYELAGDAFHALSAAEALDSGLFVDGAQTIGSRSEHQSRRAPATRPYWAQAQGTSDRQRTTIVLGAADPTSCLVTGAHRIQLPIWHGGKSSARTIVGVCESCGVQKTHPARPRWKKTTEASQPIEQAFVALERRVQLAIDWDRCFDALVHVGGGPISALERVASYADASSLFADEFVRTLEALGHIDVERDGHMNAFRWEVNPSYLAETSRSGFFLAGLWPESSRRALQREVEVEGGRIVSVRDRPGEITSWFVQDLDAERLRHVVERTRLAAEVVPDAAAGMVEALPPLSEVEAAIPLDVIPVHTKTQRLELAGARWLPVPGVGEPGAYRVEQSFRSTCIWVNRQGARDRQARVASPQMVKHLAARAAGEPLLAHAPASETLVVPLGADLPGLYGRVATLCSGLVPLKSTRTRSVAYRQVPRSIAERLAYLLSS